MIPVAAPLFDYGYAIKYSTYSGFMDTKFIEQVNVRHSFDKSP